MTASKTVLPFGNPQQSKVYKTVHEQRLWKRSVESMQRIASSSSLRKIYLNEIEKKKNVTARQCKDLEVSSKKKIALFSIKRFLVF